MENGTTAIANGDGQSTVTTSPPAVDPTWQRYREAEERRTRQRLERQLRTVLRRLVAAEAVRIGDHEAVTVSQISFGLIHPFVDAAVKEYVAVCRFEQLELAL